MTRYEFTTVRNGRRAAVIVEAVSVERAAEVVRRTMAPSSVQFVGASDDTALIAA